MKTKAALCSRQLPKYGRLFVPSGVRNCSGVVRCDSLSLGYVLRCLVVDRTFRVRSCKGEPKLSVGVLGGFRTEGDSEKEGLHQTLQMLQRELGDQQALLSEVR